MDPAGSLAAGEWRRKAVHAGMGLCALLLRWLDWKMAAALAAAALLFNLFVMPRIGRGIYRDPSKARDPGIVAYPAAVLALILLFRHQLAAAAALWGMMALGDPAATIVGKRVGGPRLAWNHGKTWSGFLAYTAVGTLAAALLWLWTLSATPFELPGLVLALVIALLFLPIVLTGAFLESLETGVDDNWIPPIPCAVLVAFLFLSHPGGYPTLSRQLLWVAIGVNLAVAVAMFLGRIVSASGAVAGAAVGFLVLGLGGWPSYALLWAFFILGTLATRIGYRKKEERRTAQSAGGRRGARHVFANCSVPALVCALGSIERSQSSLLSDALSAAFAGAFAAALADTLGTEIGSLWGRRPISLWTLRSVAPGTPGAVSLAGLAGGLAGAAAIGAVAAGVRILPWEIVPVVAIAGLAGSIAESLLSSGIRIRGGRLDHEFANAFNTFVGAALAAEMVASIGLGRLYIPFEN